MKVAPRLSSKRILLVNLSGRGDKDVESVLRWDQDHAEEEESEGATLHPASRKWAWGRAASREEEA